MNIFSPALTIILLLFTAIPAYPATEKSEIIIYGATPAGIMAAVTLTQKGYSPVIVEPSNYVGGIMTSGLGASDQCNGKYFGGLSKSYFKEIGSHYGKKISWRFEPHVGQKVFDSFIAKNKIQIVKNTRIIAASKKENQITAVQLDNGKTLEGKIFIDASYEGDLMALAKVRYKIGREGQKEFNEDLAGINLGVDRFMFPTPISPYFKDGTMIPGIQPKMGTLGDGDDKTMAYNFRLCVTTKEGNKAPIPLPKNYKKENYELLARWIRARPNVLIKQIILFLDIPNGKYDINNNGPFSTNLIGGNWEYPEGDYKKREEIKEQHAEHIKGLFYFLMNDERVPQRLRDTTKGLGLCKDEFVENNHWPHQLYVRVARRMIGNYVLTQNEMSSKVPQPDSVAIGVCPIESHTIQRVVYKETTLNEGNASKRVTPYRIPYRTITPQITDARNLLVPVALSASHIAYSSLRMEPVFMTLGETAGLAAELALKNNSAVQEISIPSLHKVMKERKMRFDPQVRE